VFLERKAGKKEDAIQMVSVQTDTGNVTGMIVPHRIVKQLCHRMASHESDMRHRLQARGISAVGVALQDQANERELDAGQLAEKLWAGAAFTRASHVHGVAILLARSACACTGFCYMTMPFVKLPCRIATPDPRCRVPQACAEESARACTSGTQGPAGAFGWRQHFACAACASSRRATYRRRRAVARGAREQQ
jgi:hypothetical protein